MANAKQSAFKAAVLAAVQDDSRSIAILDVTSIFLGVSLTSVLVRCFVRIHVVRAFGWDDITMLCAMTLNTSFATCGIIGAKFGLGRKNLYFEQHPNHLERALLCWWLGQIFYVMTCVLAKVSIIITMLRITINRLHIWILYGALSLATAISLIFLLFTIFQCSPVAYFWQQGQFSTSHGTCLNKDTLILIAYLYSVGAAVTDLTIGLLPVALVWNLRMNQRTKIAVSGILGLGCIASAAVIIRIPFVHHYKDDDFLYNTYEIGIWSNIEAGVGITAGSLTTLRPLFRFLREGSSATRSQNRAPEAGSIPLYSIAAQSYRLPRSVHDGNNMHQLWMDDENQDYHGVTLTSNRRQRLHPTSTSDEELNPAGRQRQAGWKVERSVTVTVRGVPRETDE